MMMKASSRLHVCCSLVVLSSALHGVVAFVPGGNSIQPRPSYSTCSSASRTALCAAAPKTEDQGGASSSPPPPEKEAISDLDARVLQSMLQDGALDLESEDDMKKLLERGVAPKEADRMKQRDDESDSEYASRAISTLADTKLWKALQTRADDAFATASIYVANRIERDTKLLASIGIFAWERAVRDVARALPAAGASGIGRAMQTATKQLQSSSSFSDVQEAIKASAASVKEQKEERNLEDVNLYEEFNTPLDEIRSVTKSIRDILSGDSSTTTPKRGLRSAAPAGEKTRTERQQRAYQKRKQTVLKREKQVGVDVRRVTGTFVDAAWEVKQEIKVETNRPGYRTEGVRTAIAAGAETTSRVIAAARQGQTGEWKNILFGSKEQEQVLELESEIENDVLPLQEMPELPELPEIPPEPALVADVPLPVELLDEQRSVVLRLKFCIENPEESWLTADVLATLEGSIDPDSLRDVVTTMICARDDLSVTTGNDPDTIMELITKLKQVKNTVEMVNTMASSTAGEAVASKLGSILYGSDPQDAIQPTLMALDEIKASYNRDLLEKEVADAKYNAAVAERERIIFEWERIFDEREDLIEQAKAIAEQIAVEEEQEMIAEEQRRVEAAELAAQSIMPDEPATGDGSILDAFVVDAFDVSFEKSSYTNDAQRFAAVAVSNVDIIVDDDFQSMAAEVVSDADFGGFSNANDGGEEMKFRTVLEEEEEQEEEPNILVDGTLRVLDVGFAVAEKALFVVLPGIFQVAGTASKRLAGASRGGLGKLGWSRIGNTERGSKRY